MSRRTGRPLLALIVLALGGVHGPSFAAAPLEASEFAPAAIFWAGGRTWIASGGAEPALRFAEGWYGPDGEGVRRYRLRTEARRAPGAEVASRWTRLWTAGPTERRFTPLTPAPAPAPAGSGFSDEEAVLQFRGDVVSVGRFRRETDAEGRAFLDASAATLSLPEAEGTAPPAGAVAAVEWARARVPDLFDDCAGRPIGRLSMEGRGGEVSDWLVLGPNGADCLGRTHLVRLGARAPTGGRFAGLTWDGGVLRDGERPRLENVVDLRVSPSGRHALLLAGAPPPPETAMRRDLLAFDTPCPGRRLLFWSAAADAPVDVGPGSRLDGLRWVTGPGHPLLAMAGTHFRRLDEPCFLGVPEYLAGRTVADGRIDEWPPTAFAPTAHACRVEETGTRAWGGPDDLSASVAARRDGDALAIAVRVRDDAARPEDAVRVWLGAKRPARLEATSEGLGNAPAGAEAAWTPLADGYVLEMRVPLALAGEPAVVSVRVDDVDAAGEDPLRLWAGGAPVDGRKPLPLLAAEVP